MDKQTEAALRRAAGMLEAILIRQTDLHREMLQVADEKRDAIVNGDLAKLEKAVSEEKKLVARVEDEEKRRLAVMPLIRSGLGLDDSVEKLADIVSRLPEPERSRLLGARDALKEVLEACQLKTRHNAELLKASLEHIESFLRSLSDAASPDANYRRDGRKSGGGPTLIDRNA